MLPGAVAMTDNQLGFTLLEFLVAIVILMAGLLGLLQVINVAMDKNLDNVFRTEATMLADDRMMRIRSRAFVSVSTTVTNPPKVNVVRNSRGILKNFSTQQIVSQPTDKSKQITINVTWRKKKTPYSHSISSIITRSD
jgi:type IV pilus assembly protein PilV